MGGLERELKESLRFFTVVYTVKQNARDSQWELPCILFFCLYHRKTTNAFL